MTTSHNIVDTIIVGSGIAGLNLARKLAQAGQKVFIASKEAVTEGSSKYAQGGVAVCSPLNPEDKCESHIEDTLRVGQGLCRKKVVKKIVDSAWPKIEELIKFGVPFDKDFNMEGSHSFNRVMHVADATGRAIMKPLLDIVSRNQNVSISQGTEAISLLKNKKRVVGVRFQSITGDEFDVLAKHTVLATGGFASLYKEATTPEILTGDGIALAWDAGASLENMEFIQFHPTTFGSSSRLLTEALRGAGAILRNKNHEPFAQKYHPDADLASRDIVSRAIFQEMKATDSDFVYLDLTEISKETLETKFPNLLQLCHEEGFDPQKDYLPVRPAAHYSIGGIKTKLSGQTDVPGLYALGETASTGLHGANRLASNSLLECIVCPDFTAEKILADEKEYELTDYQVCSNFAPFAKRDLDFIQELMTDFVALERDKAGLTEALYSIDRLPPSKIQVVSSLVIKQALAREESRGVHFRKDFPQQSEDFAFSSTCSKVVLRV